MKKQLTEEERLFTQFLKIVNLVNRNGKGLTPLTIDDLRKHNLELTGSDSYENHNLALRWALNGALEYALQADEDKVAFCEFVFGKSRIQDIRDDVFGMLVEAGEGLQIASSNYESFARNFKIFHEVTERFEAARPVGLIWTTRTRADLPAYITLDSSRNINAEVEPRSLFYGFRDFRRVRKCPVCSDHFLATRVSESGSGKTEQVYCSERCGSAARAERLRLRLKDETTREQHLKARKESYKKNKTEVTKQQSEYRDRNKPKGGKK